MAKFGTNASGATISWRDNSSLDAIPWVRCASGNVYHQDGSAKTKAFTDKASRDLEDFSEVSEQTGSGSGDPGDSSEEPHPGK